MNARNTEEIYLTTETPEEKNQPTRLIDVHIYEPLTEDNELASMEQEPAANERDQDQPEPAQRPRRTITILPLVCAVLCLLVVCVLLALALWLPMLTPEATITIVPVSRQVTTTSTIIVTTGQATSATQVQGRALAAITMSQQQSAPTTGRAHQDAQAAHGVITFYNSATYAQTIPAGTLLTGADGVQIVTDQDAIIPAVSYPTLGQTTIAAHTTVTGPAGNIAGGDIYGLCCRLNVSAVNGAFTGGQLARDYQTVTQQDITTVANSLKKSLMQSEQAALQTQVHPDETLINSLPCQQSITPDHQPGQEATQVHITVSETCTGATYNTQAYQDQIAQMIDKQASKQLGQGYSLTGAVQNTIIQATQQQNRVTLHVSIAATYDYQFNQQQVQHLSQLVAGKSKVQAIAAALHVPGIQSVSVSSAALPTDIQHIRVIVVYAE